MQENTIIQTRTKNALSIIFFVLAGISLIAMFLTAVIIDGSPFVAFRYFDEGYYGFVIGIVVFLILGFVFKVTYIITITNIRIIAVSSRGKAIELPACEVSAIGRGIFQRISVATSGGRITLFFVQNRKEVYSALSNLLLSQSTLYQKSIVSNIVK